LASDIEDQAYYVNRTTLRACPQILSRTRPLEMFDSPIARMAFYKLRAAGEEHWQTLLITTDGRVAAYEGY